MSKTKNKDPILEFKDIVIWGIVTSIILVLFDSLILVFMNKNMKVDLSPLLIFFRILSLILGFVCFSFGVAGLIGLIKANTKKRTDLLWLAWFGTASLILSILSWFIIIGLIIGSLSIILLTFYYWKGYKRKRE